MYEEPDEVDPDAMDLAEEHPDEDTGDCEEEENRVRSKTIQHRHHLAGFSWFSAVSIVPTKRSSHIA